MTTNHTTDDRPNILFLFTDQQSVRAMSGLGNPWLQTPHMDAIAANGVAFTNSYCTSPVCGPSRASLLTGRYPHETGVNHNGKGIDPAIPNMGQVFEAAGYTTAYAGKWHLPESYPTANLINESSARAVIDQHRKILKEWIADTHDMFKTPC